MIEVRELTKTFHGTTAVKKVSFKVDEGELLVLLGGSGSGKTTTLKMINRLIEPTSGQVLLEGEDVSAREGHELRRHIGYVFQRLGLFPHMSVAENIAVTPELLGWDEERIRRRVDELLEMVELERSVRDRPPSSLSGGQQQRVGVARALASEPRVMLLDEPFGALDPLTRDRLQQSFIELRKRLNLTAIFVTHDMVEALVMGDRIAVLHQGELAQIGTPHELLNRPADDYVEELMSTPRRQTEIVEHLMEQNGNE